MITYLYLYGILTEFKMSSLRDPTGMTSSLAWAEALAWLYMWALVLAAYMYIYTR